MRSAFSWLPERLQRPGIVALSLLAVVTFIGIGATNRPLQTVTAPEGVLSLQFAGTPDRAEAVVASWDEKQRIYAAFNTGLDYLFLAVYSPLLGLICAYLARVHAAASRWATATGHTLAWAVLVAGLLDGVENYGLLRLLLDPRDAALARLTTVCATVKFGLILVAVSYVLFSSAWLLRHYVRRLR